jgi:hypothetical protein
MADCAVEIVDALHTLLAADSDVQTEFNTAKNNQAIKKECYLEDYDTSAAKPFINIKAGIVEKILEVSHVIRKRVPIEIDIIYIKNNGSPQARNEGARVVEAVIDNRDNDNLTVAVGGATKSDQTDYTRTPIEIEGTELNGFRIFITYIYRLEKTS